VECRKVECRKVECKKVECREVEGGGGRLRVGMGKDGFERGPERRRASCRQYIFFSSKTDRPQAKSVQPELASIDYCPVSTSTSYMTLSVSLGSLITPASVSTSNTGTSAPASASSVMTVLAMDMPEVGLRILVDMDGTVADFEGRI